MAYGIAVEWYNVLSTNSVFMWDSRIIYQLQLVLPQIGTRFLTHFYTQKTVATTYIYTYHNLT